LRNDGQVFTAKGNPQDWTLDPKEALIEKGKPQLFSRKSAEGKDKGTSAVINHGNIPPSIDKQAGGVTIEHAVQTVVLSLAGLRRLRFPVRSNGQHFKGKERILAEDAARTALAALALAAVVYQRENDFDLRSRSLLIAENPLCFELLGRDGQEPQCFDLDRQGAAKLLADAVARAEKLGLGWNSQALVLTPAPKLVKLITVSRELAKAGLDEDNADSAGDGKGV
jgi:CRISPR-associated protein Csb1